MNCNFSLKEEAQRGLIHKHLQKGAEKKEPGSLPWCPVPGQEALDTRWTRGGRRCPVTIREHFPAVWVMECWHRLPTEVVESSFLEIFKGNLNKVLIDVFWRALPHSAGSLITTDPFQSFCDSVIL